MRKETQTPDSDKPAARRRKLKTLGRVFLLLLGCLYLWVFIKMVLTGYLTWIGITVGIVFLAPLVLISVVGLAGRKALEKRLNQAYTCIMLAALVALAAFLLWPEGSGPWRPYSFDAEIAALEARRAVPDAENAALRYDATLANVDANDRPDPGDGGDLLRELERRPWQAADHPEVSAWLDSYATVVDELLQIGRMEQCRWPVNVDFGSRGAVPYGKLIHATQLLALAGNRHLGEGRLEEALQTAFCLLRSADHMRQQLSYVDFTVSFSRERPALPMIRHILVQGELMPGDVERIARRLPTPANTWQEDTATLLEFDEYRFAQLIAPIYEINEQGRIRFAASLPFLSEDERTRKPFALLGRFWRLYCYLNMPLDPQGVWPMARQESTRMARLLESGPLLRFPDNQLIPGESPFDLYLKFLANLSRSAARTMCYLTSLSEQQGRYYATCLANRRGTWLLLGLRRYRNEHGAWPEELDAITEYVPADAFDDPASGGSFVYTLDGDSFTLYSKGVNRLDEGGRKGRNRDLDRYEDDIAIWPPYVPEPPPGPVTEAQAQEARDEMMKQLKEIYGERYLKRMLSEPNDNQDAKNRTQPNPQ